MASVYRRGRVWWVRFRADGDHVRRSAHTEKKSEAQAYLLRLMDRHAVEARGEEPSPTYAEAVARFFDEASIKPRTLQTYRSNHKAFQPTFSSLKLSDISGRTIADHIARRKRSGVSDATIRRDLAFLSSLFSTAIRWEWIATNPVTAISKRGLKESRPRTRFLTYAEFETLRRKAAPHLRPILTLAVETGMRREELLGLVVGAIDLERREIHLDKTKTNAPRRVPLTDTAMVTIGSLLNASNRPASPYLLCKVDGSRYVDPKKAFASACKASNIRDFRWHDLRHTFASWWVQSGG
ncbi:MULTISPECIES: tyrosine-type recombinase/integrase, partial [unclassified Microcoleus]|uniref:tyrosine-type recombinase/integrase n=1 Tax=unclassified Microcoleus TaxID=2642155 RepID=UPI002FD1B804